MRKVHFCTVWLVLLAFSTFSVAASKPYDFTVSSLSMPNPLSSEPVALKPISIYRQPTFIAGVTTLVAGSLMLIVASVLQAKRGTPLDGACSYGDRGPLPGSCALDASPPPEILFTVGGASVLTGAGLLIYWGVKKRKPTQMVQQTSLSF